MVKNSNYKVDAIQKMDSILSFVLQRKAVTFSEIYSELMLPKSSTYRLICCMMDLGYLRKNTAGKIELGIRLFELGYQMSKNIDLLSIAHPFLETLSANTGYMVHLGILTADGDGVFLDRIDCRSYTLTDTAIGGKVWMHCSAVGKALLAWQQPELQNWIIDKLDFVKFTDNTITDRDKFREQLKIISERGYSIDNTEREDYIIGVGVPVFDWEKNVVAGISIGSFKSEFDMSALGNLVAHLKEASASITKVIGIRKIEYRI